MAASNMILITTMGTMYQHLTEALQVIYHVWKNYHNILLQENTKFKGYRTLYYFN